MKLIIYKILRYSGTPFILRQSIQKRKTTIITFHDPLVDTFELTVRYLKKYYNIISLFHYNEYYNA